MKRQHLSIVVLVTLVGLVILVLTVAACGSSNGNSNTSTPSYSSGAGTTSTGSSSNSPVSTNTTSSSSNQPANTSAPVSTNSSSGSTTSSAPDFSCSGQHTMHYLPYKQQALLITTPDGNTITIHWDNTTNVDWYFDGSYKGTFAIGFTRDNVNVTYYSHLEYGYNGITNQWDNHTVDTRVAYICSSWNVQTVSA